ncbi:MAG: GSCFA domain-containing protein [Porphyromonas sp.]|nr:GSCFA domain-containing protein [Porphyromonas sp.]
MQWYKEVEIIPLQRRYTRSERIALWGSCFAEELQRYLYRQLYRCSFSPYGIIYNPISMAKGLEMVLDNKETTATQLFEHMGRWHSPMHHGSFSDTSPERTLARIQASFEKASAEVKETKLWVFTFGTSYIYEWADAPHEVVNNCHQLPSSYFRRRRVTVEEIVTQWQPLIGRLTALGAEVIFTVSPIPHYRDGAHDSRLSKAVLLLAIDRLADIDGVHYFPSYEIQLDELRDYRFFREDMAHPTQQAVAHILSRFQNYALVSDLDFDRRWHPLRKLAEHRPLTTDPQLLARHYDTLRLKLTTFAQEHPHPYLEELIKPLD